VIARFQSAGPLSRMQTGALSRSSGSRPRCWSTCSAESWSASATRGRSDGPVQVHPLSVNLYIGLVHPPRSADGSSVAPPTLLELRQVALDPPENRCMRHGNAAVCHHDHQIPQAQFEARVPAHAQNNDLSVEVPSSEQIFDRDAPLHLFIFARHPRVCTRAIFRTLRDLPFRL